MRKLQWVVLLGFVFYSFPAAAQAPAFATSTTTKPFNAYSRSAFFQDERPVEITIKTDFRNMNAQKVKGVYQDALVTVTAPDSAAITEGIKLYARGEYRRKNCDMPGLMLNFKTENAPRLSALKKMKLVCGCGPTSGEEQLLLMEYLVYKMYNQLTDLSFKVRLAKVKYEDTRNKLKPYTQYAFLMEDVDDMADRNGYREVEGRMFLTEATNRRQMTLVALFQYMIGNTDWAVPNYHNIKLVQSKTDSFALPLVVPYDFDYTGLVNAPYAIPFPDLGIEKVTDRLYRGFPRTYNELDEALQVFKAQRSAITSLIKNFDLVQPKKRETMVRYIDDFYYIIENKNKVQSTFIFGARKS